VTQKYQEIHVM